LIHTPGLTRLPHTSLHQSRPQPPADAETPNVNLLPAAQPARLAVPLLTAALTAALAGCSTIEGLFGGDKVDYRSTAAKTQPLEVPPDLTQLARDARYQPQGGVISASGARQPASATAPAPGASAAIGVALSSLDGMRIARDGQQRWLVTPQTPEQVWPLVKAFWEQRGLKLAAENAQTGVMETDWAENKAKVQGDPIRNTLGKLFSNLFDSGERDLYRTRVERTATGSEIYITHRGMEEVYTSERKESTVWRPRANDPQLEAELLTSLMLALGNPGQATAAVASTAPTAASAPDALAKARIAETPQATSLVIEEPFDRAWRRVGLALDRGGFSVEDRDRAAGLYYVRYIDPKNADKEEPGWWSKLFGDGTNPAAPVRYRIVLKNAGEKTNLTVQTATGALDTGDNAKRIVGLLAKGLK
jgi:outer membrane protein assembly factor BamC